MSASDETYEKAKDILENLEAIYSAKWGKQNAQCLLDLLIIARGMREVDALVLKSNLDVVGLLQVVGPAMSIHAAFSALKANTLRLCTMSKEDIIAAVKQLNDDCQRAGAKL